MTSSYELFSERISMQVDYIYRSILSPAELNALPIALKQGIGIDPNKVALSGSVGPSSLWSENDVVLITYGDSLESHAGDFEGEHDKVLTEPPLRTLKRFLDLRCRSVINSVHILPFYPFSSDDGFSVIDYVKVNDALGDWADIEQISNDYRLMADLVINHCSARSVWFQNFIKGSGVGTEFFVEMDPAVDLSKVVRPRTSPILKEVQTSSGEKHVWCTFSHDQVDLDFRNPEVLLEFIKIIRRYLDAGVRIFRLDAIAFLWKIPGTNCLNLEQTHEVVRLLRGLIEQVCPDAVLITETNIPNRENLSYFGNANEAHGVYNFSLPPLLINALVTGDCHYLKQWMMSMPPAQPGTTYFNFIASHDGIGLRPTEGLLDEDELSRLVETMKGFGGKVSMRALDCGKSKPYEINISLYDALQGTLKGPDQWNLERFVCAHAIMFALEGIPGLYIHSLLGTHNDLGKVANTNHNRAINRHRWNYGKLEEALADATTSHSRVFEHLSHLLAIRIEQAAFHPNATQFTLHLGRSVFGFWRQSIDRSQSIFCLFNITDSVQILQLGEVNLIALNEWTDLISAEPLLDIDAEINLKPYQCLWLSNT